MAFIHSKQQRYGRKYFVYVQKRKSKRVFVGEYHNPILAALAACKAEALVN